MVSPLYGSDLREHLKAYDYRLESLAESELDRFLRAHDRACAELFAQVSQRPALNQSLYGKSAPRMPYRNPADPSAGRLPPGSVHTEYDMHCLGALGANARMLHWGVRYNKPELIAWCARNLLLNYEWVPKFLDWWKQPPGEYGWIPGLNTVVTEDMVRTNPRYDGDDDIDRHADQDGTMEISLHPLVREHLGWDKVTADKKAADFAWLVCQWSHDNLKSDLARGVVRETHRYGVHLAHFAAGHRVGVATGDAKLASFCHHSARDAVHHLFGDEHRQEYRNELGETIGDYNFGGWVLRDGVWERPNDYGAYEHGGSMWYFTKVVKSVGMCAFTFASEGDWSSLAKAKDFVETSTRWGDPLEQHRMPLANEEPGEKPFRNGRCFGMKITTDPDDYLMRPDETPVTPDRWKAVQEGESFNGLASMDSGTMGWRASSDEDRDVYHALTYTEPGGPTVIRRHDGGGDQTSTDPRKLGVWEPGLRPMEVTNASDWVDAQELRRMSEVHSGRPDPDAAYMNKLMAVIDIGRSYRGGGIHIASCRDLRTAAIWDGSTIGTYSRGTQWAMKRATFLLMGMVPKADDGDDVESPLAEGAKAMAIG